MAGIGSPKGVRQGGRKPGTPNKVNKALKDMILQSLEDAGGLAYLTAQAHENPKTFLLLLGRVLPLQVTGEGDKPIEFVMRWAKSDTEGTSDPAGDAD